MWLSCWVQLGGGAGPTAQQRPRAWVWASGCSRIESTVPGRGRHWSPSVRARAVTVGLWDLQETCHLSQDQL